MTDININNVLCLFLELSGEQYFEGATDYCGLSLNALKAALKSEIDPARQQDIEYAAACMAFFRYTLKKASCDASSFKAGDITVKQSLNQNTEFARRLLEDALAAISDLVIDRRFKFQAV